MHFIFILKIELLRYFSFSVLIGEKRLSAPQLSCTFADGYNPNNHCAHSDYEWTDSDDNSSSDWNDDDEEAKTKGHPNSKLDFILCLV